LADRAGNIWVATNDTGIFVLKENRITQHFQRDSDLPANQVHALFEDTDGSLWFGTEGGLVHYKNQRLSRFSHDDGLPVNSVRSIARDGAGKLWIATYGGGLCTPEKNSFRSFTQDQGLVNNTTHFLITDRTGRIWAATADGVTRIEQNGTQTFTEREGLCSDVVMCMLEDRWGNIWFGTSGGGVCRLDGERFIHYNDKSGDMGTWIYAVYADKKGTMWFGTSAGGATSYDGTYYTRYFEGAGFTSSKVRCMAEDTAGTIWFGTVGDGIYSMKNNAFRHYPRGNGQSSNFINAILVSDSNKIWFATAGGGICIYDPTNDNFTKLTRKNGITNDRFFALAQDKYGYIWAGSSGSGVYQLRYDSTGTKFIQQFTEAQGLCNNIVRVVKTDQSGVMWFGTAGGGISRYDGKKWTTISKKDGLASNNIYLMQKDQNGDWWIGTEKGLDRMRIDSEGKILSVRHYGKGEGLAGIETSLNAACMDSSGALWFGTIFGATRYRSAFDFPATEPPQVHLTGIRLFFDPIEQTKYGSNTPGWFPIPATLELPYTENHLRFEFTGIDLRNPEGVRFRWKLQGFDKDWTPENTERQATFSNLPAGNYTFLVQARNADGVWSKEIKYAFRITPPIWATWPFRIAVAACVLLLVAFFIRWRIRRAQRRNLEALQKVTLEKQVLELEQKALRLQMNPHFIFNALQSIQGFIARNDPAEARRYLAKFGKLMRATLENSRTTHTTLAEESELLRNYLGLEQLCHGNRFSFEIEIDAQLDPEDTSIPVMLIQPFVENAVVHGVQHLQQAGKITVRFLKSGTQVRCEVEDNGVGRARAKQFKQNETKTHESAALDITKERLQLLNQSGSEKSSLEIIDLKNGTGDALGTRVVLVVTSS
ncbi:MAG: ligand-binding sensor domain-containing protein, partial [Bacteroidia bacterium]